MKVQFNERRGRFVNCAAAFATIRDTSPPQTPPQTQPLPPVDNPRKSETSPGRSETIRRWLRRK